jgi:hypothetical protein
MVALMLWVSKVQAAHRWLCAGGYGTWKFLLAEDTAGGMSMNKVVLGMARDADVQSARVHDPHRWLSFSRFTFAFLNHL